MAGFRQDLRFSLRLLARSPVFAFTVSLLLGIGVGANTLIFSIVDALLLRTVPVKNPEQLVRLIEVHPTGFVTWDLPHILCEELAASTSTLTGVMCQGDLDVGFDNGASTQRIRINSVSPDFFAELQMRARLGRVLTHADDNPGILNAVLNYDFWRKQMGGAASVVGRTIRLNGRAVTIVGVLREEANGLTVDTSPDVRVSFATARLLTEHSAAEQDNPLGPAVQIFARLRTGTSLERAEAEIEPRLLRANEEAMLRAFPKEAKGRRDRTFDSRFRLESAAHGISSLREKFSRALRLLMASVALLLLMACGNVAGLLLSRSAARSQEISLRIALGAGRWRIARQLLTESLVLAIPGGIMGVLFTYALRPVLLAALPPIRDRAAVVQPLALHLDIDLRVLGFVTLVTLMSALLCGLAPALGNESARTARTATTPSFGRSSLIAAQVAICVLLLAGAGVLVETFQHMQHADIGFDSDHVVTFTVDPSLKAYTPERASALSRQLLEKARSLPGVEAAAIAGRGLMRGTGLKMTLGIAGKPVTREDFLDSSENAVTPDYFRVMGMHFLAGRDFTWFEDATKKPKNVIVNEAFVRHFFPGQTAAKALGERFGYKGPDGLALPANQIVSVVNDSKYRSLREPVPPTVYEPVVAGFGSDFILHLRTRGDPAALIAPVRELLRSLDPELPLIEAAPLRRDVEASLWQERLLAWFSSILGGFAALLAGLGLYGALDFAVRSRTREVGIRVALGADPPRVVRLLSRQTILLVTGGSAAGIYFYFLCSRWIRQLLYDVAPFNAWALASALFFILMVTLISIAAPIWKAVRIEPSAALRHE